MNKVFQISLFSLLCLLFSCDSNIDKEPSVSFKEYETFLANKNNWTEPKNYNFSYIFRAPYIVTDFIVNVENDISNISCYHHRKDILKTGAVCEYCSEYAFKTMKELYNFLNNRYLNEKETNKEFIIDYSVFYNEQSYPEYGKPIFKIIENRDYAKHQSNLIGIGPIVITITNFTIF